MNEEPYTLVLADLGKNIREARIAAGWKKQSEFERDCGLKASVLSHIEKGTRGPSLNTFVRMPRQQNLCEQGGSGSSPRL